MSKRNLARALQLSIEEAQRVKREENEYQEAMSVGIEQSIADNQQRYGTILSQEEVAEARVAESEAGAEATEARATATEARATATARAEAEATRNRETKIRILAKARLSANDKMSLAEIERKQIALHSGTESLPVVSQEAGGAGDCFYHALIQSAFENGADTLLASLTDSRAYSDDRPSFIKGIRNFIADNIAVRSGLVFDRLGALKRYNAENLNEIMHETFSQWQIDAFNNATRVAGRNHSVEKAAFIASIEQGIRTMGNDVSEIEVEFIAQYLERFGLIIKKHNSKKKSLPKIENGMPVLHLLNVGNYHWVYFTHIIEGGGRRKLQTKKQRKQRNKRNKRKLQTRK